MVGKFNEAKTHSSTRVFNFIFCWLYTFRIWYDLSIGARITNSHTSPHVKVFPILQIIWSISTTSNLGALISLWENIWEKQYHFETQKCVSFLANIVSYFSCRSKTDIKSTLYIICSLFYFTHLISNVKSILPSLFSTLSSL